MNGQRRKKTLEWTDTMEKKFLELKGRFLQAPIRSYPKYSGNVESFKVTTDWSAEGKGAVLSQVQDGKERLIGCMAKKNKPSEARYPSHKGELAALIMAIKKWHHILSYAPFTVVTDSTFLKYLNTAKPTRGMHARWLDFLANYDFHVIHKPGKDNVNADALSRCKHADEPDDEDDEDVHDVHDEDDQEERQIPELNNIRHEQDLDENLGVVRGWMENPDSQPKPDEKRKLSQTLRSYFDMLDQIRLDQDGVMRRHGKQNVLTGDEMRTILIPDTLRDQVYKFSHQHLSAGHFGIEPTLRRAQRNFFFPGMATYLRTRVGTCATCLKAKTKPHPKQHQHVDRAHGYVGQRLWIDLVGPMNPTREGNKYVLTCQDAFSRYVWAFPLPDKSSETVFRVFHDRYLCSEGPPEEIYSDQGTEFCNKLWDDMCKKFDIKKSRTMGYSPNSNSIERFHRSLHQLLRTHLEPEDTSWDKWLATATLAFNTKISATTGATPYMAKHGRECNLPVDLVIPKPRSEYDNVHQQIRDTSRRFGTIYKHMIRNQQAVIRRNAKHYAHTSKTYYADDLVWYFCPRGIPGKTRKITPAWIGPMRIKEQTGLVKYRLEPTTGTRRQFETHVSNLQPYLGTLEEAINIPPIQIEHFIPENENADELAEELGGPARYSPVTDLMIPIQQDAPYYNIGDLPRLGGTPDTGQQTPEPPTTPDNMDTEQLPRRDRGKKRSGSATPPGNDPKTALTRGEKRPGEDQHSPDRERKQALLRGEKRAPTTSKQAALTKKAREQSPVVTQAPQSPVRTQAPKSRVGTHAPSSPVVTQAPQSPARTQAHQSRVEIHAPASPAASQASTEIRDTQSSDSTSTAPSHTSHKALSEEHEEGPSTALTGARTKKQVPIKHYLTGGTDRRGSQDNYLDRIVLFDEKDKDMSQPTQASTTSSSSELERARSRSPRRSARPGIRDYLTTPDTGRVLRTRDNTLRDHMQAMGHTHPGMLWDLERAKMKAKEQKKDEDVGTTYLSNNQSGSSTNTQQAYGGTKQTIELHMTEQVSPDDLERLKNGTLSKFDVRAGQSMTIDPGEVGMVETNLKVKLPTATFLRIMPKIDDKLQAVGQIIESSTTETVRILVYNKTNRDFKVQRGQRIAQAILYENKPVYRHPDNEIEKEVEPIENLVATMEMALAISKQ